MDGTDVRVAVDTLSLRPLSPPSRLPPVPSPPMGLPGSKRDERVGDLCISISKIIYRGTHLYIHVHAHCKYMYMYMHLQLQYTTVHVYTLL